MNFSCPIQYLRHAWHIHARSILIYQEVFIVHLTFKLHSAPCTSPGSPTPWFLSPLREARLWTKRCTRPGLSPQPFPEKKQGGLPLPTQPLSPPPHHRPRPLQCSVPVFPLISQSGEGEGLAVLLSWGRSTPMEGPWLPLGPWKEPDPGLIGSFGPHGHYFQLGKYVITMLPFHSGHLCLLFCQGNI